MGKNKILVAGLTAMTTLFASGFGIANNICLRAAAGGGLGNHDAMYEAYQQCEQEEREAKRQKLIELRQKLSELEDKKSSITTLIELRQKLSELEDKKSGMLEIEMLADIDTGMLDMDIDLLQSQIREIETSIGVDTGMIYVAAGMLDMDIDLLQSQIREIETTVDVA